MGRSELQRAFGGVDWGVSTADGLAAPSTGSFGVPFSGPAQRWSLDLAAVVGDVSPTYQAIAGWPYLQPERRGVWDRTALDRCDRRIDRLLSRGVRPGLTLLHVDAPPWVDASGGWLNRDTAWHFAEFAAGMGERFGDRVAHWTTMGELLVHSVADYVAGMLPTGHGVGLRGVPALHHVLLGAGLAVQALKQAGTSGQVGSGITLYGAYAASDDIGDRIALERFECWAHRLFLDPMLLGRHLVGENDRSPVEESGCVRPGDMEAIAASADVLGVSWYVPTRIAAPENLTKILPARECFSALNDANRLLARLGFALAPMDAVETTAYGWPVVPEALADAVAALHDLYGAALPPLHIVDNGACDVEPGAAADTDEGRERRRSRLAAQLGWLARVMAEGVRVNGYEYLPLTDNLGWKLHYTSHYAMAIADRRHPPQPPIPLDWAHHDAFGGTAAPGGGPARTGKRALHAV